MMLGTVASGVVVATSVSASDDFNRGNSNSPAGSGVGLGSSWSALNWGIASNKAVRKSGGGTSRATFQTSMGKADHFAQVDYVGNSQYCLLCVRVPFADNSVDTSYHAVVDPSGAICIAKNVAGTYTQLSSNIFVGSTTGTLYISVVGDLITVKRNGSTVVTWNDSTLTSGNFVGFIEDATAPTFDNFSCGSL